METQRDINAEIKHEILKSRNSQRRGRMVGGLLIVAFGVLYLLKVLKIGIPGYLLSWQMILIGIGTVILVKHKFRKLSGYFLILIGAMFLFSKWYPDVLSRELIMPILIILGGVVYIFKPKRNFKHKGVKYTKENWKEYHQSAMDVSADDFIEANSIFGGVQKNVVTKQFRGADIVSVFGGTEINFSQADFEGRVVIETTNIFGGTNLNFPSNWQVISEVTTVFGAVEDKRPEYLPQPGENSKVVVLKGTCLFGGIEINSFAK